MQGSIKYNFYQVSYPIYTFFFFAIVSVFVEYLRSAGKMQTEQTSMEPCWSPKRFSDNFNALLSTTSNLLLLRNPLDLLLKQCDNCDYR